MMGSQSAMGGRWRVGRLAGAGMLGIKGLLKKCGTVPRHGRPFIAMWGTKHEACDQVFR